jgi:hypothetical protein
MAQPLLKDPIVSAGPTLTGVGNGTLAVDKLTHFTTAQSYTLTCIAKSPDTLFSVVGSLDGPIGIATVGIQFFDDDLKIFLTIQQGPTPFEVGDIFELTVVNGTDLHQDNIDDYDELSQKNFGLGVKGTLSGDHNVRYSDNNVSATLSFRDLKFTAAVPGAAGNLVQVQYADPVPAVPATLSLGGFDFTAVPQGSLGNTISVEFIDDVINGSEFVGTMGQAIQIHLQGNTSTRSQVLAALNANPSILTLISYVAQSPLSTPVPAPIPPTFLSGGTDPIGELGDEEAVVVGNLVRFHFVSGKVSAQELKTAFDINPAALALATVAINGDPLQWQYTGIGAINLSGGKSKFFSLNKHELTETVDFFEGNASVSANDLKAQGRLSVVKDSEFKESVTLDDANVLNNSGNKIPNVQRYINHLIQDLKISLRTADHSKVQWAIPDLSFEDDIVIEFNDSGLTNKVAVAESPISIPDGHSFYVILDRYNSVYVGAQVGSVIPKTINAFRIATRHGDNLVLWDNTLVRDGKSVRIGEGGEGGGVSITEDRVVPSLGSTVVTFVKTYSFNSGAQFFRNGQRMEKVSSFVMDSENRADEYMEVNAGNNSTQITLHPNFPADGSDVFIMWHAQNAFVGIGLAEKTMGTARGYADGTGEENCTISTVSNKTRMVISGFTFVNNRNPGSTRGDAKVEAGGIEIERLVAGINDIDGNVVYEEVGSAGNTIDIYEIVGGLPQALPSDAEIRLTIDQYFVADLSNVNSDIIPAAPDTYTLGALSRWFKDLFVGEDSIHFVRNGNNYGTIRRNPSTNGLEYRDIQTGSFSPIGEGGESGSDLLSKLSAAEASQPFAQDPAEIVDPFNASTGVFNNMSVSGGALSLSGANLSGSYTKGNAVSQSKGNVEGLQLVDLVAVKPNTTPIALDTVEFDGDITAYFAVNQPVLAFREFDDGAVKKHRHLHTASGDVILLSIDSISYNSSTDRTTIAFSNPTNADLTFGQTPANQTSLRFSPFDMQFLARGSSSTLFDELTISDANIVVPNVITIPGQGTAGNFALIGIGFTGSIQKSDITMSPNRVYGVIRTLVHNSGSETWHYFGTKDGGNNWFNVGTRTVTGGTYAEETLGDGAYFWANSTQMVVADNGKFFAIVPWQQSGVFMVRAVYGDLSPVSPTFDDTPDVPTDPGDNIGGGAGYVFTGVTQNSYGVVSGDLTDLSLVAVMGAFTTSNDRFIRWYTNGGATHLGLSSNLPGAQPTQPNMISVSGSGTAHRTHLFFNDGAFKYVVFDQPTLTPTATTTIAPENTRTLDQIVSGTRKHVITHDLTNSPRTEIYSGQLSSNTIALIGPLIEGASNISPSVFQGSSSNNNVNYENYFRQMGQHMVVDPGDDKHFLFAMEFRHPDGVERATLAEVIDSTNFNSIQISQYTANLDQNFRTGTNADERAMTFTANNTRISTAAFMFYQVGSIAEDHTMWCEIQETTSSLPNGTVVATSQVIDPNKITKSSSAQWLFFNFPLTILTSGVYAFVLKATFPVSATNYLLFKANLSGGYSGGETLQLQGGTTWQSSGGNDMTFFVTDAVITDVGNALHNTLTSEGRDRHNFECTIQLVNSNSNKGQLVFRKTKNPQYNTTENSYPGTGHIYRREITINAGAKATIGPLLQNGYQNFDDNLIFSTSLGSPTCERKDQVTGAGNGLQGEDRSGFNNPANTYQNMTSANFEPDVSFQSGRCLNFNGVSERKIVYANTGIGRFKVGRPFIVECEVKPASYSGDNVMVGATNTTSGNSWDLRFNSGSSPAGKLGLRLLQGTSVTHLVQASTPISLGTYIIVRVVYDGLLIKMYTATGSNYAAAITAGFTEVTYDSGNGPVNLPYDMTGVSNLTLGANVPATYFAFHKMGYVKISDGSTAFTYSGFQDQSAMVGAKNAGIGILVERKIGQNSELQANSYLGFDEFGFIDNQVVTAVVDSYRKLLKTKGRLTTKGADLEFKVEHTRASVSDSSKLAGYIAAFRK